MTSAFSSAMAVCEAPEGGVELGFWLSGTTNEFAGGSGVREGAPAGTPAMHYLDVARVLLHDTKAMLALPGRTYDLRGPGWQQEHGRMGPGVRGTGAHRTWLPWVSVNHLHAITGLEEFDPTLYQRLAKGD